MTKQEIEFRDPVVKRVVNKFVSRSDVGFAKYGVTLTKIHLKCFNGLITYKKSLWMLSCICKKLKKSTQKILQDEEATYKRKSKKRGPVRAKKVSYDGIDFASGLEKYMYMALRKAKIKLNTKEKLLFYLTGFHFENEVYERQSNGKGDYKNRGCKRILPIKVYA